MEMYEYLSKVLDMTEEACRPRCQACHLPIPPGAPLCPLCDQEMMAKVRANLRTIHEGNL